jgi:phage terminase Nu1 subunit (DNA packaging protein)
MAKSDPPELPETVSIIAFAALLGLSARRVHQQINEGKVRPAGRGTVELGGSIRALLADAREGRLSAPLSDARAQVARARARSLEIANAQAENRLMLVEDHDGILDRVAGLFLEGVGSLPARIAGNDIRLRHKVEVACDEMRGDLAKRMGALAEADSEEGQDDA